MRYHFHAKMFDRWQGTIIEVDFPPPQKEVRVGTQLGGSMPFDNVVVSWTGEYSTVYRIASLGGSKDGYVGVFRTAYHYYHITGRNSPTIQWQSEEMQNSSEPWQGYMSLHKAFGEWKRPATPMLLFHISYFRYRVEICKADSGNACTLISLTVLCCACKSLYPNKPNKPHGSKR